VSTITADRLVKAYIKIREARQEISRQDADLEQKQDMIQSKLLEVCKETGAESLRTEFGTVTRRVAKKYWTHDWESFYKFVKEHDAFPLLQKRISITAMQEFLEEYPDLHPPGLNVDSSYVVSVRRKS
jgi:ATP-dependent Lon protease